MKNNSLILFIKSNLYKFKNPDNPLDSVIRKNIVYSFGFQILSNLLGLLVVPLSLAYIDKEKYGVWITASAIVTWLQYMNFGMGLGMQNKVTESLANKREDLAQDYVSIVYLFSSAIAVLIGIIGFFGSFFINWNKLFNSTFSAYELKTITFIAFISFLFYFVLGNINSLFNALKLSAVPKFLGLMQNAITTIFLIILNKTSHNNLIYAAIAFTVPIPLVFLCANIFYFKIKFKTLKPTFKIKDKRNIKSVFGLGLNFFLLQICNLFVIESSIFIITQYLGPAEVTPYSIINRYFYFLFFIFSMAINPYWAGFNEAYVKNDFLWIKKSIRHLLILSTIGTLGIFVMLILSYWFIPIWSKHSFDIKKYTGLVYATALYIITLFFSNSISVLLCGLNKLRIQLVLQIVMALLSVLLPIIFIKKFNLSSVAVVISAISCQFLYLFVAGRLAYKIIFSNILNS